MKNFICLIFALGLFLSSVYSQFPASCEEYYKFDETSGQAVNSVNSSVNNSSSVTATQGSSGIIGNCYTFNGTTQYVYFADHTNWTINATDNLSISMWINFSADPTSNLVTLWGHQDGPQFNLGKISSANYNIGWWTNGTGVTTSSLAFSTNTWYHIVLVKSGSSITFYRNGVSAGSSTTSDITINPSCAYIGGDTYSTPQVFNGRIDEVGIWKRTLTSTEVAALYNSGSGLTYSATNYALSAIASPTSEGSVTLSPSGGSYTSGTNVTATAIPGNGYSFTGWSGSVTDTTNPLTIIMNSNKTITANFSQASVADSNWHTNGLNIYYSTGNVGIGTSNPTQPLTVNGKILATEVEVVSSISADYVFESSYPLMTLPDLEEYINQFKHLPCIPSAEEFREKGQNLGKMDDILLMKIEELTLYLLKQEETYNKLIKQQEELKAQVEKLDNKKSSVSK
jgi:uncharacterized repeat protein (TIGR02543 family)